MDRHRTGRTRSYVVFCYLAGVVAAASYGKVGPVSIPLQDGLGLTLGQVGWTVSTVDAVSAVLGAFAGVLVSRGVQAPGLALGLALTGAASLWAGLAHGFGTLVAARVLEGLGYLVAVTAAPSLITIASNGRERALALSLWATFVPVGLSLGTFAGGFVAGAVGWRGWFASVGVVVLVFAAVAAVWRPDVAPVQAPVPGAVVRSRLVPPLLLGTGFCLVVAMNLAVISLFPVFLARGLGMDVAAAGGLVGVVTLLAVPGGMAAGWLLRSGVPPRLLLWSGLLMPPAGFAATWAALGTVGATVGFAVFVFCNGMLVALLFSAVPSVAADARTVTITYGLLSQLGGIGSLLLPPVLNGATSAMGWWSVGPLLAVLTVAGILVVRAASRPREEAAQRRGPAPSGRAGG